MVTQTKKKTSTKVSSIKKVTSIKKQSKKISSLVTSVKSKLSSTNKIPILPHQLAPIRYLVSRCKDQHGLLLNHIQGSGKTLIGLFLAKNYPDKKVVLIAPRGIETQWLNQAKIVGVKIHLILNYDELTPELLKKNEKTINDSILIIDECHHIIEIIQSITEGRKIDDDDGNDGNDEPEEKKHVRGEKIKEKTKKVKKEAKNALIEVLNIFKSSKKVLLLSGTPIRDEISDFRWLINIAAGKRIFPYNEKEFKDQYYYKNPVKSFFYGWVDNLATLKDPYSNQYIIPDKNYISFQHLDQFKPQFLNFLLTTASSLSLIKNIDPTTAGYNKGALESMFNFAINIGSKTARTKFLQWAIYATIISFSFIMVLKLKNKLIDKFDFERLNLNKIKIASPYISYYKYDNLDYYPATKISNTRVQYTEYQTSLFTRLASNINITDQESVNLEFNKTLAEAELFKPTNIYYNKYFDNGRKIGNLKGINPITKEIDYPIKFIKIANRFKKNPQQTMVYSSFSNSLYDLQDYLKKRNINAVYFHPKLTQTEQTQIKQDYYKQKIKMLLIHPVYYEGFDIKGVRIFHVLEPVMEYFKREQLYARPVRYLSHAHLPKNERNVIIVQWICSMSEIFDMINTQKYLFKNWFSGDKEVIYFARMQSIKTDYTADECVFNGIEKIADKIEDIQHKMKTIRIDNSDIPMLCNVYGDTQNKKLKKC